MKHVCDGWIVVLISLLFPLFVCGQPVAEIVKDKQMLLLADHNVSLDCRMDIPQGEVNLQQEIARLLFGDADSNLKQVYTDFLTIWKYDKKSFSTMLNKFLEILVKKEYQKDEAFACYHVSYRLRELAAVADFANANPKQIAQYKHLAKRATSDSSMT